MREESINMNQHHVCRPLCNCCGGGDKREGKRHAKAASRAQNRKARRSKPKYKDHGR